MVLTLILLALLQDPDLESLVGRLDHQDATVRMKAVEDLIRRGAEIVPKILALHRATTSPNVRAGAESVLRSFRFKALAGTRPDEPLHKSIQVELLKDLETHRSTANCWLEKEKQPRMDASRLLIRRQSGSGHGQTLQIEEFTPDGKNGLKIRLIAYETTTPYRPKVQEEGVRVQEAGLDPAETGTLSGLLVTAMSLRTNCAMKAEEESLWSSSANFTRRLQIESAGQNVWNTAYTGYPGRLGEKEYIHGEVVDGILQAVLKDRIWSDAELGEEGRAKLLQWISDNFKSEDWWVRERYLAMARLVGDVTYLPFLRKVAAELEGKSGASEGRQLKAALDAIERIKGIKKQE